MQEIDLCEATGWMQRMSLMFFFLFSFIVLAEPGGMWDLISSLTRDGTHVPCIGTVNRSPLGL